MSHSGGCVLGCPGRALGRCGNVIHAQSHGSEFLSLGRALRHGPRPGHAQESIALVGRQDMQECAEHIGCLLSARSRFFVRQLHHESHEEELCVLSDDAW